MRCLSEAAAVHRERRFPVCPIAVHRRYSFVNAYSLPFPCRIIPGAQNYPSHPPFNTLFPLPSSLAPYPHEFLSTLPAKLPILPSPQLAKIHAVERRIPELINPQPARTARAGPKRRRLDIERQQPGRGARIHAEADGAAAGMTCATGTAGAKRVVEAVGAEVELVPGIRAEVLRGGQCRATAGAAVIVERCGGGRACVLVGRRGSRIETRVRGAKYHLAVDGRQGGYEVQVPAAGACKVRRGWRAAARGIGVGVGELRVLI